MGAVAMGGGVRTFAAAQPDGAFFLEFQFYRREAGALVGAVAERLIAGAAAGAPPINAGVQLPLVGGLLRTLGFCHWRLPPAVRSWAT